MILKRTKRVLYSSQYPNTRHFYKRLMYCGPNTNLKSRYSDHGSGIVMDFSYPEGPAIRHYSNHLNTGLVRYSDGRFVLGCQMVRYWNGGLKTD